MILRDRLQILDDVLKSAQTSLEQYKSFAEVASQALIRAESYIQIKDLDPKDVLDMFNKVHEAQMQTLTTLNSVIERFPVEHTIQELQVLEFFRNLTERQKRAFMSNLEASVLQNRANR